MRNFVMKNRMIAKTIVISGFGVFLSYGINFFLTPYISDSLGIEAYGFIAIAKSAVSYANIAAVALTSFIVRYISVSYHKRDYKEAQGYYSSSVLACILLSGAVFLIASTVIWNLESFLIIPVSIAGSVKMLFAVVFVNFMVTTITTPFGAAAYIKNRMDWSGYLKILGYVFDAVFLLFLFHTFSPEVWFAGAGSLLASFVTLICSAAMTKILTPELQFKKAFVSARYVKTLIENGIWNSFNQIGNTLNSGLDLIISNLMLSGTETGQIAVAKTIGTMFSTLYQVVFQPFQPRLIKAYAQGDMDALIHELQNAMKICGCFSNIAFAGFAALGRLYFELWLPQQDSGMLERLAVVTVLGSVTAGVIQPVYYVNTLTVRNRIPCAVTIFGGVVNVWSMYLLLKYTSLGPVAVVATTSVIMISINLFFNPVYSARCLGIKARRFYSVMIPHMISAGIMTAVFRTVGSIINPQGWTGLILSALLMCAAGVLIHGGVHSCFSGY